LQFVIQYAIMGVLGLLLNWLLLGNTNPSVNQNYKRQGRDKG